MSNHTKTIRAAIYARISTNGQSTEPQLLEVREYAARKGGTIVGEYIDAAISGSRERRPELDVVVVYRL